MIESRLGVLPTNAGDLAFKLTLAERLRELKVQRIVREINCSRTRVSTRKLDLVIFSALPLYEPKSDALAESEGCHKRSSARQPSLAFRVCCNHLAGKKGSDTRKAQ